MFRFFTARAESAAAVDRAPARHFAVLIERLEDRTLLSVATQWQSRGPGGGGAFFSPSFSPYNASELYVASDMSNVFHTTNLGASWNVVDFRRLQGGPLSQIQFTNDPSVLYCLDYTIYPGDASAIPKKSTNGGASWTELGGWVNGDGSPRLGDGWSLHVDPSDANRLIVSDYNSFYYSGDGGATFSQKYVGAGKNGLYIAGAFFDGPNIYVGTADGLVESHDGGASFSPTPIGGIAAGQGMYSFTGASQNGATRFFCVTFPHNATQDFLYPGLDLSSLPPEYLPEYSRGVYSLDVGQTSWTDRTNLLPAGVQPRLISMAPNDINTAYVAGNDPNAFPTVARTTDGGGSWTSVLNTSATQNVATGWSGHGGDRNWDYGGGALGFEVSPIDPNELAFTDLGFTHVSTDGGATWNAAYVNPADRNALGLPTPQHKAYHGVGLEDTSALWLTWPDANTAVAGYTDIQGVRSTDGGSSWSFPANIGLAQNTVYQISTQINNLAPSGEVLYAATSNIHDIYQSTRLTDATIDAGTGSIIYSTDKGASWATLHDFGHPVIYTALDPTDPNRLYASVVSSTAGGIYVTNDLSMGPASTWTKLPAPPRTQGHPFDIDVLNDGTLVASFSARQAPHFTASSGVFAFDPSTQTWSDRTLIGTIGLPGMQYWTKDITIDPTDPQQNTWYAAVRSGYGGDGSANAKGGLYRTTDRGLTWKRIFNFDSCESATVTPAGELYVATTGSGLWYSANPNAAAPKFIRASYSFRQPERIFINPFNPNQVWVASFGYGLAVGTTPITASVTVGDGTAQRSVIKSLTVIFNRPVTLSSGAITLTQRPGTGATPGNVPLVIFTPDNQTYFIAFTGGATEFSSLQDGVYDLTVHAALVSDASGGTLAGGDLTTTLHRLFGDINGDKTVSVPDYFAFNRAFGKKIGQPGYLAALDFNSDGIVNNADYFQFRKRYGKTFNYTLGTSLMLASPAAKA